MAIRRSTLPVSPLTPGEIAVLLGGWTSAAPGEPTRVTWEFLFSADLGGLWTQYERLLRSTAESWGWGPRYFVTPQGVVVRAADSEADADDFEPIQPDDRGPYFFGHACLIARLPQGIPTHGRIEPR
jgi:hypothetical protein